MTKKYHILNNNQRTELCRLIHDEGLTIKEAARLIDIPYPNAKAVNKVYENERRTNKKIVRTKNNFKYLLDDQPVVESMDKGIIKLRPLPKMKSVMKRIRLIRVHSTQVSLTADDHTLENSLSSSSYLGSRDS